MRHSDESETPFLEKEGEEWQRTRSQKSMRSIFLVITVLLLTVVAHASLFFFSSSKQIVDPSQNQSQSRLYSPFDDYIEYETVEWSPDSWDNSPFSGPPRKEVDDSWNHLQRGWWRITNTGRAVQGVKVLASEVPKLNFTSSLPLKEGGQASVVGYYHNLHCLRFLYQREHPETYDFGEDYRKNHDKHHFYHCIEMLRASVMCKPDLTLHQVFWEDEEDRVGVTLRPESKRECVNFDKIYELLDSRKFRREDMVD